MVDGSIREGYWNRICDFRIEKDTRGGREGFISGSTRFSAVRDLTHLMKDKRNTVEFAIYCKRKLGRQQFKRLFNLELMCVIANGSFQGLPLSTWSSRAIPRCSRPGICSSLTVLFDSFTWRERPISVGLEYGGKGLLFITPFLRKWRWISIGILPT